MIHVKTNTFKLTSLISFLTAEKPYTRMCDRCLVTISSLWKPLTPHILPIHRLELLKPLLKHLFNCWQSVDKAVNNIVTQPTIRSNMVLSVQNLSLAAVCALVVRVTVTPSLKLCVFSFCCRLRVLRRVPARVRGVLRSRGDVRLPHRPRRRPQHGRLVRQHRATHARHQQPNRTSLCYTCSSLATKSYVIAFHVLHQYSLVRVFILTTQHVVCSQHLLDR